MTTTNPKVDAFIACATAWQEEMKALRTILLGCGLREELKWGKPCYVLDGHNVAILQGFREALALMFFKGSLMRDPDGILEKPGENSRIARRIMIRSKRDVTRLKATLRTYILHAMDIERSGAKVEPAPAGDDRLPDELTAKFKEMPALERAFSALSPGRQRGYLIHFASAKQSTTRASRIEKCMPAILDGRGLHDR